MGIDDLTVIGMNNVDMPLEVEAAQRRRDEHTRERQVWVPTKVPMVLTGSISKIDINASGQTPAPRHATSVILQTYVEGNIGVRVIWAFYRQGIEVARVDYGMALNPDARSGQIEVPIFDGHYVQGVEVLFGVPVNKAIYPVAYRMA